MCDAGQSFEAQAIHICTADNVKRPLVWVGSLLNLSSILSSIFAWSECCSRGRGRGRERKKHRLRQEIFQHIAELPFPPPPHPSIVFRIIFLPDHFLYQTFFLVQDSFFPSPFPWGGVGRGVWAREFAGVPWMPFVPPNFRDERGRVWPHRMSAFRNPVDTDAMSALLYARILCLVVAYREIHLLHIYFY